MWMSRFVLEAKITSYIILKKINFKVHHFVLIDQSVSYCIT